MEQLNSISRRRFVAVAGVMGATLGLAACGGNNAQEPAAEKPAEEPKKEEKPTGAEPKKEEKKDEKKDSAGQEFEGTILAVGSSALQPLAEAASKEFMKKHPKVQMTVQGGGSGTGISTIAQGGCDIGNSDVFAEEKDVDPKEAKIKDHKVCIVGMGPIVNPDVKVDDVTKQQLKDIFMGKVTNWKDLGGDDQAIVVINRAAGSGTRATFETFALDGETAMQSQEQDNSGTVAKMVAETPGAISYLAFSYFTDKIKPLKVDGVEPKQENIMDNSWLIWAYEHMYTAENPTPQTQGFVDFMLTDEVQQTIIPELGYIPVSGMKVERDVEGNVKNL